MNPIYADAPNALRALPNDRASTLRRKVSNVLEGREPDEDPADDSFDDDDDEPEHVNAGPTPRQRRKRGPNKAKPEELPPAPVVAPAVPVCRQCGHRTTTLSSEVTHELLRSSRDKLVEITSAETRGLFAESDLLYVAARLDGYCGLACWRKSVE